MSKYHLQLSFSTQGEDNTETLRELRNTLAAFKDAPLRKVYDEFKLIPTTQLADSDRLINVDVVHSNTQNEKFSFFVLQTETHSAPFFTLWISVCKQLEPRVRCDVVGSGPGTHQFCQPLFVPKELKCDPGSLPLVSERGDMSS